MDNTWVFVELSYCSVGSLGIEAINYMSGI